MQYYIIVRGKNVRNDIIHIISMYYTSELKNKK